jgi:hypothetical protein
LDNPNERLLLKLHEILESKRKIENAEEQKPVKRVTASGTGGRELVGG